MVLGTWGQAPKLQLVGRGAMYSEPGRKPAGSPASADLPSPAEAGFAKAGASTLRLTLRLG